MRHRNWTFYKVILYLGLLAAVTLLSTLCFVAFYRYSGYWKDSLVQLIGLGSILQITFYLLCIRLVHYYVPGRLQPGKSFNFSFIMLLIFNGCIAIGLLLVLAFGFSRTFLQGNSQPTAEDYTALFIVGGYTFTTVYISATSIILHRYNRYQAATDEEQWLNQLGNPSLNQ